MFNSPKRSIRLKNKLGLKNDADTDPPVSADFNKSTRILFLYLPFIC